jgi:predicted ABC-class ATPase
MYGQVLLVDEDTAAANFIVRDLRMMQLVAREKEPITPAASRYFRILALARGEIASFEDLL